MLEQKHIKKIYEAAADELSRKIFCSRLLYSMTGDIELIRWMMDAFCENAESNEKWIKLKHHMGCLPSDSWRNAEGNTRRFSVLNRIIKM